MIRIIVEADVPDPTAAMAEMSRAIAAGDLDLTLDRPSYSLVSGQRLERKPGETAAAFDHRVRSVVSKRRAGFSITVG